ncbi:DNA helicase MCM8-like isoform X2 [Daphnia carinata]|uniref:DNA helicase MCM8-like isoform X2 n=1 Tax=Daphnia carinata TaxID=120202 RepID=UPI00257EE718|nr:DNA helicase MCM8-like isoform X2 [Daphnia carinata]
MADQGSNSRGKRHGGSHFRGNNNWRSNRWRGRGFHRGNGSRENASNEGSCPINNTSSSNHEQDRRLRQRSHIDQHFPPVDCPYKGWKHYFPTEDFVPTSRTVQQIKWTIELFSHEEDMFDLSAVAEDGGFALDYQFLIEDKYFCEVWPQFKADLIETPSTTLAVLSLAMYQLLVDKAKQNGCDDMGEDLCEKSNLTIDVPYFRARLVNYRKLTPLKSLRAALFGKLVAVSGTCVRASNTTPLCLVLAFQCRTCSGVFTYPQTDGKYESPPRCILDRDGLQCTGNNFDPLRSSPRNLIVEWQSIRIQENTSENLEIGRIPRAVDCELMQDLVGTCSPGEVVTVVGIVKAVNVKDSDRGSKDSSMFTFYIEAVSVYNDDRGKKPETETEPLSETASSCSGLLTFNMKDYHAIRKIHEEPNLFAFLVASLCPSIYGNTLVKAGLLLGLFGGNNSPICTAKGPFCKRSDIHVLIVGDPGLGKSQMLHACSMVSPRGVFVCGNSTTNSGLTVTLTKDGKTNGNEYTLEAGALVLGDQGTCCIDEFDKMTGQHQALLEAMEQQSIRVRLCLNDVDADLLPAPLLRKYIAYAKEYVHPVLNEEAKKEIHDFYLHLRMSQYSTDSTPITPRQLESLVRLSQARAKAELRTEVTGQDARDVIELVKTSFDDVFKNEFGSLDFSRSQNGSGMSSRNEGKRFIAFLQSYASRHDKLSFSFDELKALAVQCNLGQTGNFKQFIETLNNQNYLLNKGGSIYKLVS